jgi:hypothetical protein
MMFSVKILLLCDDLMSRTRLASAWKTAGAQLLGRDSGEAPDLAVVDLATRNALEEISRLRSTFPAATVLAFGPHVDGEAFKAAKAAGASEVVARAAVVERVLRRFLPAG